MLDRLESCVHDGAIATLLADRDLTGKGPIVDFLGEPCRLPPGAAALARRTGAPVHVGAFLTEGAGYRAWISEAVDVAGLGVAEGTQLVAYALGRIVRDAPEQWHVFVRNWLGDREPDHAAVRGPAMVDPVERGAAGEPVGDRVQHDARALAAGGGIIAGVLFLLGGLIYFLSLYVAGEALHLQLAVEENTRLTAALLLRMHQDGQVDNGAAYGAGGFNEPYDT
jgi:hypothetical protein